MLTTDQQRNILKARIALALYGELGRVPTTKEVNQFFFLARVLQRAVPALRTSRKAPKQQRQPALF